MTVRFIYGQRGGVPQHRFSSDRNVGREGLWSFTKIKSLILIG